jgi:hypothetical protein
MISPLALLFAVLAAARPEKSLRPKKPLRPPAAEMIGRPHKKP